MKAPASNRPPSSLSTRNRQPESVNRDDVVPYLRDRLPDFAPTGLPVRLPEGNLNRVWRVPGRDRSVIVKHAPPFVAADPDIPLDPSRLHVEAQCLQTLGPEGKLRGVPGPDVRPPRALDVNPEAHVLVMEDIGKVPTLGRWLRETREEAVTDRALRIGHALGAFIGRLHRRTTGDAAFAEPFDNRPVQETRHAVQYQAVGDLLARGGISDAEALGARAEALGTRLLQPGRCLTMGDLWPPSVLVTADGVRLIDWEFAHYGQPMQDVAHFAAHLWMQAHRAPSETVATAATRIRQAFLAAYRNVLVVEAPDLLDPVDASIHFGAEILVRTVGRFQEGYLYDGLSPDETAVQEAVRSAARHIREPWGALRMWIPQ